MHAVVRAVDQQCRRGKLVEASAVVVAQAPPVAARALFHIALDNPEQLEELRSALKPHASSRGPIARIWANKTLAMLDLAEMARAAEIDREEEWEEIAAPA